MFEMADLSHVSDRSLCFSILSLLNTISSFDLRDSSAVEMLSYNIEVNIFSLANSDNLANPATPLPFLGFSTRTFF